MSHYHLLSHIPGPLRHFDNNTPVGMTQSPHPLVCHRLLFKQPPRPSAPVLVSMSHKTRWCLELCSPPHASPAPLSSGLAPSPASGGLRSSQDCQAGIPPSRCWPNMWPRSQTGWGPGVSQSHPLGFSARFRSFITWERCGSGGWQRDGFRMPQGLGAGGLPTSAGIQPWRVMARCY